MNSINSDERLSRRPRANRLGFSAAIGALCAIILLACNSGTAPRGSGFTEVIPTTFIGTGPEGIEQRLFITPPKSAIDDPIKTIEIESTITNKGAVSVALITRSCQLYAEDLTSAAGVIFAPRDTIDCEGHTADTVSLGPGQSLPTVSGKFDVQGISGGVYEIQARQILKPSFLTQFRFRMPGGAGA